MVVCEESLCRRMGVKKKNGETKINSWLTYNGFTQSILCISNLREVNEQQTKERFAIAKIW